MRLTEEDAELFNQIEEWRAAQRPIPSKKEAVVHLLRDALTRDANESWPPVTLDEAADIVEHFATEGQNFADPQIVATLKRLYEIASEAMKVLDDS